MKLAGEPPSFAKFAARPTEEWHDAQNTWMSEFSEGRSTLPSPGMPGSTESKARAAAWKAATKQHGRAKRMAAAIAGEPEANDILNQLAAVASTRHARKHGWCDNVTQWHPRPPGPSPHGFEWEHAQGQWVDTDGNPRSEATRNQRRVQQRQESEQQTLRHKRKWELYESCERRRRRCKGEAALLTAQEKKAYNAGWRLHALSADLYSALGYSADADRGLCDSMGDVIAAARKREADARAAIEREREERAAAYRAEREREAERLERERVAPERLAEGRRLTEGFAIGDRVEFRTVLTYNLKTGNDLDMQDWVTTEWQPGTLTKVVTDGHIKCAYGVAWLEVKPDGAIPGRYLRRGEAYVIPLRDRASLRGGAGQRERAGVYERVRVLDL